MKRYFPWLLAGLISLVALAHAVYSLQFAAGLPSYLEALLFVLPIFLIAFMGALIVVRRQGHRVGWLMLFVALAFAVPVVYDPLYFVQVLPETPASLSPGLWLLLWLHHWFWVVQIVPLFRIILLFPAGRPPPGRWRWINSVTLVTLILAAVVPMFMAEMGPLNGAWDINNPLGYLPQSLFETGSALSLLGMFVIAVSSLIALFSRFRKGSFTERQQIKWLIFAGVFMIGVVALSFVYFSLNNESPVWLTVIFQGVLLIFPLAIANAILRYRLYEIDILIRRTLQYTLLTGLLVSFYYGGIVLLQRALGPVIDDGSSSLVTVLTTLVIAALFNPLRVQTQHFIDQRFFRQKYDAEKMLVGFAAVVRDEVDLKRLSSSLISVIEDTMQPEHVSLWLNER